MAESRASAAAPAAEVRVEAGAAERSTRTGRAAGTLPRTLLWLLLGGWVGSWGLFGLVIAPTAFRVLPSIEVAGTLVGPVLATLHLYGAGAGIALAALAAAMGRGRLRVLLPLLLAVACLISQFGVSTEIAEIRELAFGPEGSEAIAARWNLLHRISVGIYLTVSAGALWLVLLHAASDAREAR